MPINPQSTACSEHYDKRLPSPTQPDRIQLSDGNAVPLKEVQLDDISDQELETFAQAADNYLGPLDGKQYWGWCETNTELHPWVESGHSHVRDTIVTPREAKDMIAGMKKDATWHRDMAEKPGHSGNDSRGHENSATCLQEKAQKYQIILDTLRAYKHPSTK